MPPKKKQTKGEAKTAEKEALAKEKQDREAAEQADKEEQERQDAKAAEAEEQKEKVIKKDYADHLHEVEELKAMTETKAWQKFYANLRRAITKAGKDILDAEKTREIIRYQESVKIIRQILVKVREPVDEMNTFCNAHPLFVAEFPVRPEWNEATGTVELSGKKSTKK